MKRSLHLLPQFWVANQQYIYKIVSAIRRTPPLLVLLLLLVATGLSARNNPNRPHPQGNQATDQVSFRQNCANAVSQIDQQINNVRARLTTGGDIWWDGSNGRYIVPKPAPGAPEVSALFAAGIWIAGRDPGGNIKVAAQQYGRGSGNFDYYPGPLHEGSADFPGGPLQDPRRGTTGPDTCARWDQ